MGLEVLRAVVHPRRDGVPDVDGERAGGGLVRDGAHRLEGHEGLAQRQLALKLLCPSWVGKEKIRFQAHVINYSILSLHPELP